MKPATALAAAFLAVAPGTAAAQVERTWNNFEQAGAPPSVPLPRTIGVPVRPAVAAPPPAAWQGPARTAPSGSAVLDASDAARITEPAPVPAPAPLPPPVPQPATPAPAPKASAYAPGMRIVGVARVVDGHSLHVSGHALRLHGVEAPGLSQACRTRGGTSWPCGRKAHQRLDHLAGGQRVACVVVEPSGEGAAATCSVRGISDLARIMAEEGWAVPNGHDGGRYVPAAESARKARAGLWTGTFEAPWTFRRRH